MTLLTKLTQLYRNLPLWERVVWVLVVLCLVGAVTVKPLVRWVSPQFAVTAAAYRESPMDLGGTESQFLDQHPPTRFRHLYESLKEGLWAR